MKIEQRVEIKGDDVVLRLINHDTREQTSRIYAGLGRYAALEGKDVVIRIPARVGLNIKAGAGR
jgi:hypothetical protein